MNKMQTFIKHAQTTLSKHSPDILTGLGIASAFTMAVLAVKATPKALERIDKKKREEHKDSLTPVETFKAAWTCYIPAAVAGGTTVVCILGARSVNARRTAALATAYQLSETALSEYREKVVETLGEKKEKTIREKVAKDRVEKQPADSTVYITEKGETLFLDPISGRLFKSDIELVRKAVNNVNYALNYGIGGYVSLNEFYDDIGLERTKLGDHLGWNLGHGKGQLDVDFFPEIKDGKPCICLDYMVEPEYDYDKFR